MRLGFKNKFCLFCGVLFAFCAQAADAPLFKTNSVHWLGNSSYIYPVPGKDNLKTYYLKTDSTLRDSFPSSGEIRIDEDSNFPRVRSGSPIFDGLFAMAILEVKQSSVSMISDHSFKDAECECFETGQKWKYVWTRDISYAADLGLASVDPQRTKNSMEFKLSGYRSGLGQGEQIVQDTGTGGSWPISTDRTIWALGAYETLLHLNPSGDEYKNFKSRTYNALKNTVLADRVAAFDPEDGLYTGEQSFLDWREQSYPDWTSENVVHIGMSKSLSTNIAQLISLKRLSDLTLELNNFDDYTLFNKWAQDLNKAIYEKFWDGYSLRSLKSTFLDQRATKYYDLLGVSLGILEDVIDSNQGKMALNHYPVTQVGPPVIWPQKPDIPIYHNRAIWPFVTAYALKAAKKVKDASLITAYTKSLMLGPAQNLSNMENYEFLTLRNWFSDGVNSGPVVNSRRQLWSTAGYISMVMDVIFGKEVQVGAIRFRPAITEKIRKEILITGDKLTLHNLSFHNKKLDIEVHLPPVSYTLDDSFDGVYEVYAVYLNDNLIPANEWIQVQSLKDFTNKLVIKLDVPEKLSKSKMTVKAPKNLFKLTTNEYEDLFAPKSPFLSPINMSDNYPLLTYHSKDHNRVSYLIYKNEKLIATTKNTHYLDKAHRAGTTVCYTVVAMFDSSKNESLPSEPFCYWPEGAIQNYPLGGHHIRVEGNSTNYQSSDGRIYLKDWGSPDQKVYMEGYRPNQSGYHAIQVDYNNIERINTGITCAVKKIRVYDELDGRLIRETVLILPHHNYSRIWSDSNFVRVDLDSSRSYKIVIEDFQNMSYFSHFESYKHRGGQNGFYNKFNFAEIKILRISN